MLVIATLDLIINLVSMRLLGSGKDSSLNIKGAYLEVWSDMLGSWGVIVAAVVIRFTGWAWVDTLVAVGIGLWVLPRTWVLLKESLNILLEGTPEELSLDELTVCGHHRDNQGPGGRTIQGFPHHDSVRACCVSALR